MKILHVTRESAADRRYGLGRSLSPVVQQLQQSGSTVRYLCQDDLGHKSRAWLHAANLQLQRHLKRIHTHSQLDALLWGITERLNMGRLASMLAAREGYTHVHLHDPLIAVGFSLFSPLLARKVAWGFTEHGFGCYAQAIHEDGAVLGTRTMARLRNRERRISLQADWVIAPTRLALDQLGRDLGVYPQPLNWKIIHHPHPQIERIARAAARERLGWDPDGLYLIAVGRLVPLKRFDLVIRAAARADIGPLQVVLVGEGDHGPLQQVAAECGLQNRVHFAYTDDIAPYYSAADLYLCASRTESFGLANLEAMTAGLPIVSTTAGGIPEVLGDAAHWVPVDRVDAMAAGIRLVIGDPQYAGTLRSRALARAESWPDIKEISRQYELVYEESVAKADRGLRPVRDPATS